MTFAVRQDALDDLPWQEEILRIIPRYSTNQDFTPYDLVEALETGDPITEAEIHDRA